MLLDILVQLRGTVGVQVPSVCDADRKEGKIRGMKEVYEKDCPSSRNNSWIRTMSRITSES